jgi:Tfp pilus assembly protein PilN
MRAVNLIPAEARRGAGAPSRSNGAVYGVLGILGVLALVAVLYGLSARTVNQREAELAALAGQTVDATARTEALAPYSKFVKMAKDREETVTAIAGLRFDWGVALREIARVVPADIELTSLTGSRGGDAAASAAGTATPQFQIVGCANSQADVAVFLARLRAIDGVVRVRLDTAAMADGTTGAGPVSGEDCRQQSGDAQFTAVVFFGGAGEPATGATAAPATPGATPGTGTTPAAPANGAEEGAS